MSFISCGIDHYSCVSNSGKVLCFGGNNKNQCHPIHSSFTNVIGVEC